ncbi:MAG: TonB-dependent receptor, partial [Nitrosopumilaceae archaeon]|nr:TonB-dependent receptor [Nitrosopumilaceae archaeon]
GREKRNIFDLDYQFNFPMIYNNELIAGVGLRFSTDDIDTFTDNLTLNDNNRSDYLYSAFIQDKITLFDDRLNLVFGSKFEHNDYSGFEIQPNFRFIVKPNETHRLWGAVSRAVRIPDRIEENLRLNLSSFTDPESGQTTLFELTGNDNVDPEELIAFELGYRFKPSDRFYLELAGYINYYDDLSTFEPSTPFLRTSPAPHV